MTSEQLKKMLPNVEVRDRSAERQDSLTMLNCLQKDETYQVLDHYVRHRNDIEIPYDDAPTGAVHLNPEFGPKDFLVLSVGGNDFALRHETNPTIILGYVRQVIQFYKSKGILPSRIIYFTPYPPTGFMKFAVRLTCKNLDNLYHQFIEEAEAMCAEEGVTCIPLDFFGDDEKAVDTGRTLIPEPTPYGAWKLASMIQERVLATIEKEESEK